MGKITGFLEFERLAEASEAVEARKKHYREFVLHLSDEEAKLQGARCMDCGTPFCMSGCPADTSSCVHRSTQPLHPKQT